jgi:hypothetical protein
MLIIRAKFAQLNGRPSVESTLLWYISPERRGFPIGFDPDPSAALSSRFGADT